MTTDEKEMNQLLELETDFGLSLLRQQNLNESLVFSPLSISLALSLLHVAANGQTKDQIREALVKGVTDEQIEQHYSNLMKKLEEAENGTEINIANRIFSNEKYHVKQNYLDKVQQLYKAGAESMNFKDSQATAQNVNKFISDNTGNNINNIIESSAINDDIVAFLVNAIYFKGKWINRFKAYKTMDMDFFAGENNSRKLKFMSENAVKRNYAENNAWQMLQLPYKDQSYSLNIFLPKNRFGLQDALKNIDAATIQSLIKSATEDFVNIRLPKMRIEKDMKLTDALKSIGIVDAFTTKADLNNLADDIYISKAKHKAMIEVDEDGTTAAATTVMEAVPMSLFIPPKEPVDFVADHPFMFALAKDGHPLFVGVHH